MPCKVFLWRVGVCYIKGAPSLQNRGSLLDAFPASRGKWNVRFIKDLLAFSVDRKSLQGSVEHSSNRHHMSEVAGHAVLLKIKDPLISRLIVRQALE